MIQVLRFVFVYPGFPYFPGTPISSLAIIQVLEPSKILLMSKISSAFESPTGYLLNILLPQTIKGYS